jgi:hypothetical protein
MLGDWVTFFLALLLVPVLLLEETSTDPGVVGAATVANALIWVLFALDYAIDLWQEADRRAYVRSHWFDLAIIVVSPPLLALRVCVEPVGDAFRVLDAIARFATAGEVVVVLGKADERRFHAVPAERDEELLGLLDRAAKIALRVKDEERRLDLRHVCER